MPEMHVGNLAVCVPCLTNLQRNKSRILVSLSVHEVRASASAEFLPDCRRGPLATVIAVSPITRGWRRTLRASCRDRSEPGVSHPCSCADSGKRNCMDTSIRQLHRTFTSANNGEDSALGLLF